MAWSDIFVNGGERPIIDMHTHLGPFHGFYAPGGPIGKLIKEMDRVGVEIAASSHHNALAGDTREGNKEMLAAVRAYPERILGYCVINPNFPDDIELEIKTALENKGVIGFKIHPEMHKCSACADPYKPMWERADAESLIVLAHTWGEQGGCGADDMRRIAERYPNTRLILGHSCYGAWDKAIGLAKDFPNAYLEISAAHHVYGLLERMCVETSSEKILFGTDYPWFDPLLIAGSVVFAHIETRDIQNILYNNARKLIDEQRKRRT
jgi:predicted TIM-barrel fold metal-dependent hydrolase